jgi:hypothetical protein
VRHYGAGVGVTFCGARVYDPARASLRLGEVECMECKVRIDMALETGRGELDEKDPSIVHIDPAASATGRVVHFAVLELVREATAYGVRLRGMLCGAPLPSPVWDGATEVPAHVTCSKCRVALRIAKK